MRANTRLRNLGIVAASVLVYLGLSQIYLPFLELDGTFFISWFVTFLHEFGHIAVAYATGGGATQLVMFPDIPGVAGYACTYGGWRPAVIMGGYIGSALFGAFFLYSAFRENLVSRYVFRSLAVIMVLSQILWFPIGHCADYAASGDDAFVSVLFCVLGAVALWNLSRIPYAIRNVLLIFVGTASMVDVLIDVFRLRRASHSDLHAFTDHMAGGLVPMIVWQAMWVAIIVAIMAAVLKLATVTAPEERGSKPTTPTSESETP